MLRRTLITTLGAVVASAGLLLPALQAQTLDKSKPRSEPSTTSQTGTVLPPMAPQPDLSADTLKTQVDGLIHSLTDAQRAQIGAVLQDNAPTTPRAANAAMDSQASLEALQAQAAGEPDRLAKITAEIRATLTPEQAVLFDATLPTPPDEALAPTGPETRAVSDCYSAYQYNYNYVYPYAYNSYVYAYYNYLNYSSSDPIAYQLYSLAYYFYNTLAYSAYYYSYNSYYYGPSYYRSAWVYSDYATETAYALYYLAYSLSYYWTANSYAYNTYSYSYYSYYYGHNYATPYAYNCAH
jgi:hypothetical protein